MKKLDTTKLINTAANAFVSAVCGGIGAYAVNMVTKTMNKNTAQNQHKSKKKNPIGFDMRGDQQ